MIAIAATLLLSVVTWQTPSVPAIGATVRICSPRVAGAHCAELAAATIDPTLHLDASSQGSVAFVDPETGALVEPTAEQLRELVALRAHEIQRSEPEAVTVETLPNGTTRATLGPGFMVDLVVETVPVPPPPAQDAPR